MEKTYTVFGIRCSKTGRMYIGITGNHINSAITPYFSDLKNGRRKVSEKRGKPLVTSIWQADYDRYGRDAFDVYMLERDIAKEDRTERKDFWINRYRTMDERFGYNRRGALNNDVVIEDGLPPLPDEE